MKNKLFLKMSLSLFLLSTLACRTDPISGETNPDGSTGGGGTGSGGIPSGPVLGSTFTLMANPEGKLDLVFVIDNSRSMLPKQEKLAEQFPKLIDKLRASGSNPNLLDLHIAIVNSDLGTGISRRCASEYGSQGKFQMPDAEKCGVNDQATFLEYKQGKNINFDPNKDVAQVFGCLATAVGQDGCGFEQPLQALNWAFNLHGSGEAQRAAFIRPDAYLGIVILTDEDDCSTEAISRLAVEERTTVGETWSLRCATRGHRCGGANLTYPTTASFEKDFTTCEARKDYCDPKETGENPTSCSPLSNIKTIADQIKHIKGNDLEKILVAGIFGWPTVGQTTSLYKIEKTPNMNVGQPDIFDYWPVCYDPNHPMPITGAADHANFNLAFGYGGFGGLRIKAFLDEFPASNVQVNSICEPDYSSAMDHMGTALAYRLSGRCLPVGYTEGSAWEVFLRTPQGADYIETLLSPCTADSTTHCYRINNEAGKCSKSGLMFDLQIASGIATLPEGTLIRFQRS